MITIKSVHKYDCDVLIAGGGPAGSALAFHLSKKGLKVIVAETERFPRDKICGDGVSPIALAELEAMGIKKWKKFSLANEISKVGLFIKNDKVFIDLSKPEHLPFHARIIPRIELDNWIYETAKKAGATGGKISGAGGGGFMIFYCPGNTHHAVIDALKKFGGEVKNYTFTKYGLTTWCA